MPRNFSDGRLSLELLGFSLKEIEYKSATGEFFFPLTKAEVLQSGSKELRIYGYPTSQDSPAAEKAAIRATKTISFDGETLAYTTSASFSANPEATGKGSVDLKIKVPAKCTSVTYSITDKDGADVSSKITTELSSGTLTISSSGDGLDSGTYSIWISFYDNATDKNLLAIYTEQIDVWPGCETNRWYGGSGTGEESLDLRSLGYTTFFVLGESPAMYGSQITGYKAASDDNTGGISNPLAKVSTAVKRIVAANDGSTEYTIYVDGTVEDKIKVDSSVSLKLKIQSLSGNAAIKAKSTDSTGTVLEWKSSGTLTLKNITIDGNKKLRCLYVESGTVSGEGVAITNGFASDYGGGVKVMGSRGNITLDSSSSVTKCEVSATGNPYGGGIYGNAATITLNGTTLSGNKGKIGAGICFAYGELNVNDCSISGNESTKGGGIFVMGGSAKISGGTISSNTAKEDGGGVYVQADSLTIKDDAIISGNTATNRGGGIYVKASGIVNVEGGKILGNTATSGGGAVYIDSTGGTLNIKGSPDFGSGEGVNEICLASGRYVSVSGKLTCEDGSIPITSSNYKSGTQLIQAADGYSLTESDCQKFRIVTNAGENTPYTIVQDTSDSDKGISTLKLYVSSATATPAGSATGTGTKANPFLYIDHAINAITSTYSAESEVTIIVSGEVSSKAAGTNTSTVYLGGISKTLNFQGATGSATDKIKALTNCRVMWVDSGTVNLSNITLTGGRDVQNGAGIYMAGGTVNLKSGAVISDNEASNNGGGVCVNETGAKLTMEGGSSIEKNSATNGGGVLLNTGSGNKSLIMEGGTISGNTCGGNGSGVWVGNSNATFSMSNSAKIVSGNDVYLNSGATIKIDGALSNSTVATITPSSYTPATTVLSGSYVSSNYSKFTLANSDWNITSEGKLTKSLSSISVDEIQAKDSFMIAGPIANYTTLLGKTIFFKTSNDSYGAMQFTDVSNNYSISFKYKIGSGDVKTKINFRIGWGFDLDGATTDDYNKDFGLDLAGSAYNFVAYNGAKFCIAE